MDQVELNGHWVMSGEMFLEAMNRAHAGEDPQMLYIEYYGNSQVEWVDGN